MPSFHSHEEQSAYERADEAYDRFLEIREECRKEWEEQEEDDEDA